MAQGDFCHVSLFTNDPNASQEFYEGIFGWTFEIIPGFATYLMFRTPNGFGGGFDSGPNADQPDGNGPDLHIEVDDIDATLAKINEAGGSTIVPKTKISDEFGHFAIFTDNVGNRLALWSN